MPGILPQDPRPWTDRRDQGLHDTVMRDTLGRVTRRVSEARIQAYAHYPEGEAMRSRAKEAKRAAIRDLDRHLIEAAAQIEAHGGVVRRMESPHDVSRYIIELARRHQARRIIKSKSMMTEELELNHSLEAAGLAVRETDLGEYIIQLAHEKPSHILAPAAHKNRHQIHTLFNEEAQRSGVEGVDHADIPELTAFARRRLREEFLIADIGITGGNFLVAETGTLVLITNEGNADMVTALPPLLISVVGIEKLVATWEDLTDIIQQPALSGVGQLLSSYTTFVSGPRGSKTLDGPKEWHVLLVNNGRSGLRGTEFEDVLSCIRCGACLNVCPVFRQVGGHAYGSVYVGPIGAVEPPLLAGLSQFPEMPSSLCTLCNACQEACPMDIALPQHFLALRREKVRRRLESPTLRLTYRQWGRLWATPAGYRLSVRLGRIVQKLSLQNGRLVRAPGPARGWFNTRDMPPIAQETFHEWWKRRKQP